MSYNLEQFKDGLKELQIELNEKQISQFLKYYELLVETNKVMNLTAITEFDEVVEKHFLDSLSLYRREHYRLYLQPYPAAQITAPMKNPLA